MLLNTISTSDEIMLYFESDPKCKCGHEFAAHHHGGVAAADGCRCIGTYSSFQSDGLGCKCQGFEAVDWITGFCTIPEEIHGTSRVILS